MGEWVASPEEKNLCSVYFLLTILFLCSLLVYKYSLQIQVVLSYLDLCKVFAVFLAFCVQFGFA